MLHASTDQVYSGLVSNSTEQMEVAPVNVYGKSKAAMEKELLEHDGKLDHVIFRLSLIYGPPTAGAHDSFLQFSEKQLTSGKEFVALSDEIRSAIAVTDVVKMFLFFLARPDLGGVYNAGGPADISRSEFVYEVAKSRGLDASNMKPVTRANCTEPWATANPSPPDISLDMTKLTKVMGERTLMLAEAVPTFDALDVVSKFKSEL